MKDWEIRLRAPDGSIRSPTDADIVKLALNFYWPGTRWMRFKFWFRSKMFWLRKRV